MTIDIAVKLGAESGSSGSPFPTVSLSLPRISLKEKASLIAGYPSINKPRRTIYFLQKWFSLRHDYIRKISCWLEWLSSVFPAILFKTNQWYNILLGNTQKDCWVHRKRVLDAIHWLKANNALYYKKIHCHLQLMGHCKNCSLKMMLQIVCKLHFPEVFFLSQFTRSKITVPSGQLNYMSI